MTVLESQHNELIERNLHLEAENLQLKNKLERLNYATAKEEKRKHSHSEISNYLETNQELKRKCQVCQTFSITVDILTKY